MIHLTFSGYYAGQPLCGCDRYEREEAGDQFIHASSFPFGNKRLLDITCQDCLDIWNGEEDGDHL